MNLSLDPWMLWSEWTKHICLVARKRMADHQVWKGCRSLGVFQCSLFRASKMNMGACGHFYICGRCGEGSACRTLILDSDLKQSRFVHFSFTFWIWNNLLYEILKDKALTIMWRSSILFPLLSKIIPEVIVSNSTENDCSLASQWDSIHFVRVNKRQVGE